jgi:hypothetical protein
MNIVEKTYDALFFRQRADAPVQVAFVAPSSEVDGWARVPTKKTGNIRNFQRAEIPRHIKEVSSFFNGKENASPTSIVVGFDGVRAKGKFRATDAKGAKFDYQTLKPGEPAVGQVHIMWAADSDPVSAEEFASAILARSADLKDCIYTELKELTDITDTTLDKVVSILVTKLKSGVELDDGEDATTDEMSTESASDVTIPGEVRELLQGLSPSEQSVGLSCSDIG